MVCKAKCSRKGYGLLALVALAMVSLFAAASRAGAAQQVSLFVRKTFVNSVVEGKTLYAPVDDLLRAMGFQWTQQGDAFMLAPGTAGGPDIRTRQLVLAVPGKTFTPQNLMLNKRIYVNVKQVTEGLGGLYIDSTKDLGIVQVSFPTTTITQNDLNRAVKEASNRPMPAYRPIQPASTGTPSTVGDKAAPSASPSGVAQAPTPQPSPSEDPVKVVGDVQISNPVIPGSRTPAYVQGTAKVKNTSDQPVTNVRITVTLNDRSGQPLAEMPVKAVATMAPGETVSDDFNWYNYQQADLEPKVKIEHDPIAEKKAPTETPKPSPTLTPETVKRPTASPSASPSPSPSPNK
jgi:hypothetical protein